MVCLFALVLSTKADRYIYFDKLSFVAGVDNEITSSNGQWHYNGQQIKCVWDWGPMDIPNSDYIWTAVAYGDVKLISNGSQVTTITRDDNDYNNNLFSLDFTNAGGAIVVTAVGKQGEANGYWAHYVITIPYPDEHAWNFYDKDNNIAPQIVQNDHQSWDLNQEKIHSSNGNRYPISVAAPANYPQDNCYRIDGTNAYYIPSTAGLIFNTADKKFGICIGDGDNHVLTFGGSGSILKIPQVPNGYYIKIWWDAKQEGNFGANFIAKNVLDLDGADMNNQSFKIAGIDPNTLGTELKGVVIFKVKDGSNGKNDVSFELTDNGWNDLYKIEIVKDYSTDMRLFQVQDAGAGWLTGGVVDYNSEFASIVHKKGETAERMYGGTPQASILQRAYTCDFDAEAYNGVSFDQEIVMGKHYKYLNLTNIDGTGNIKITQRERFGDNGYVLNKKETWLAVGEYTEQSYPYTWDFTDYNVKKGSLNDGLSHSIPQKYGYWGEVDNTSNNLIYGLDTHVLVDASKVNNSYVWNNVQIEKPLFAQGSQLVYGIPGGSIGVIKETEGLRIKQCDNSESELGVGNNYDREVEFNIKNNGGCLKFVPKARLNHKLYITIPNVTQGMWVFIKANRMPDVVKAGANTLSVDEKSNGNPDTYDTQDNVWAYQVTNTGDVDICYQGEVGADIEAIGVTNIFKSINLLGYATESRDVKIDHSYEGFFTNNDVNAYCILADENGSPYNYKGTPIVVKSEESVNVVPENTGIVLYKSGHDKDKGGFNVPLFYPACNVTVQRSEQVLYNLNMMAPNVARTEHKKETETVGDVEYTKFVMSRQYYVYHKLGNTGTDSEEKTSEQEAFYRMRITNVSGTSNFMEANKAYLRIPTAQLPLALWNPNSNGEGNPGQAKSGVIFMDDIAALFGEEINGVATDINGIYSTETVNSHDNTYYTLSGVKIQGKPTNKGIYIMNGKKVLVK